MCLVEIHNFSQILAFQVVKSGQIPVEILLEVRNFTCQYQEVKKRVD
jgi:hypothetical protein